MKIEEILDRAVINVDKPAGPTSREVTERVRKTLGCRKAGHTGTLDSNATGVLIVALNNAVKAMPVLVSLDKEYEGMIHLHKDIDLQTLVTTIDSDFVGRITQTPPVKSRVARKPRVRIVYSFTVIDKVERTVAFKTRVQAGTYIRKLVSDIGERLGTGAHLKQLRRTKVGHFSISESVKLEDVEKRVLKKYLIPIENAIPHVTRVYVDDEIIEKVRHGAPIKENEIHDISGVFSMGDHVGIFSMDKKLVGLGLVKDDERLLIKTDRII